MLVWVGVKSRAGETGLWCPSTSNIVGLISRGLQWGQGGGKSPDKGLRVGERLGRPFLPGALGQL